ncbi:MAG: peptide deformylase [Clostridia bacterium]|nr:peptide deformylase [Clostridia bacterium]
MVKNIVKDTMFLMQKSQTASKDDIQTARDLLDTLRANSEICVGLAANMIGLRKRIIAVQTGIIPVVMINPVITSHSQQSYETEEGCLSHTGTRKTIRWQSVEVEYYDINFKKHKNTYTDFTAQIIQHEIDHCNGILI